MVCLDIDIANKHALGKLTDWFPPAILWQSSLHHQLPDYRRTRDRDSVGAWHLFYRTPFTLWGLEGVEGVGSWANFKWRGMSGQIIKSGSVRIPEPVAGLSQLWSAIGSTPNRFPSFLMSPSSHRSPSKPRTSNKSPLPRSTPNPSVPLAHPNPSTPSTAPLFNYDAYDTPDSSPPSFLTTRDTFGQVQAGERHNVLFQALRNLVARESRKSRLTRGDVIMMARGIRAQFPRLARGIR